MITSASKNVLLSVLQLSLLSSPFTTFANQNGRNFPGAGLTSGNNRGPAQNDPSMQELSVCSYVDLNDSIQNDMYGTIQFENAQLKDIVLAISKVAGKNFILDRKLENRQVTIISPEPVTKQEAYYAFLSALNMNGLTVVSVGKFLKIIEVKSAIQANTRVFVGDYAPPSEEIVTVLYSLKHLNAEDIERFVTEMVPRTGRVTAYPDTNTLVMTDTGINLRRVMAVLKSIDTPGYQEQLESIPIRYGSAKAIAQLIQEILDAQNPSGRRVTRPGSRNVQKTRGGGIISKIVPDERTNSLVVLANGRGIKELKDLISKLDTSNAAGSGNIHIYYCKNAVAEELATTLNSLLSSNRSATSSASGSSASSNARPSILPVPNSPSGSSSRGGEISISGDLKITADKATNALVIVASGSDYTSLKSILTKLDIPRRQVYVEATIMEINSVNDKEFAVSSVVALPGNVPVFKVDPTNYINASTFANPTALNGIIAGITTGSVRSVNFKINGKSQNFEIPNVISFIRAIDTSSLGQILHQPQILTSDNQEAEIKVTEQVPVPKTTTSLTESSTPFSQVTYEKENIELSLNITPQIGEENDLVKLKVKQNIDDFTLTGNDGQIKKTKRSANTTVSVRSGDTIAIGGLQKISKANTRSRYPLLGDLPIIGWLFKGSESQDSKSNLVLFLTPHIIDSYSDLQKITSDALKDRIKLSETMRDPRDSDLPEIKKLQKKVKDDSKKAPPKTWSFKPQTNSDKTSSGIEADEEFQGPLIDEEPAKDAAFIHLNKPKSEPVPALPPSPEEQPYYAAPPAALTPNTSTGNLETVPEGVESQASPNPSAMPTENTATSESTPTDQGAL